MLNIDGTITPSRSHTHPSHTQNSCLLTSSLSLGVPVPVQPSVSETHRSISLTFSLSLHRHLTRTSLNGHLHYPNDLDGPRNETTTDKNRQYHTDYNNRPSNTISFKSGIVGSLGVYTVNL